MPYDTRSKVIKGTMILIIGNLIVKIIGALFKLPLANIIGADGMGLYNSAFIVYDIFLVLATAGFPLTVSKMVANSSASGCQGEALKIFKVSRRAFFFIGLIFSVVMFIGARSFSDLIGNTRALYSILALSPAVLFVALMGSYRGYYQGTNDMIPTTVSQVIEAIVRLIIGLSLAAFLKAKGFDTTIVAAGALIGITVGEFSSTFTLAMLHRYRMRKRQQPAKANVPSAKILKTILKTAAPVGLGIIVISIINLCDNSVVMHRLQSIGYSEYQANTLYGTYNMAFTIFSLPITIVSALQTSIFPMLSYEYASGNYSRVSRSAQAALRITMLVATAAMALFLTLSTPIVYTIYFNQPAAARIAAPLLALLAPTAIMMSLAMLSCTILQSIDRLAVPSRSLAAGGTICLVMNWFLVGNPNLGIYGAPIGLFFCYTVATLLNIHEIHRCKKIHISFQHIFLKPFIPAVAMSVIGSFVFYLAKHTMGFLGSSLLSLSISMVAYVLALFLSKSIERADILILPKGRKLVHLFEKLHLLSPLPGSIQ